MPKEELNAVVTQRLEVTPDLIILRVTPEGWDLPPFEAGQFGVIGLSREAPRTEYSDPVEDFQEPGKGFIRRAYSIASSSVATEYVEFYITLVRSGALTPRLFALEIGDRLWLGPKITGMFTLQDVPANKNVVMVATGTGLAPYMSMLRTYLRENKERHFVVLHGARHSWDLGYRSELETMQDLCDNFTYVPQISRPANEHVAWSGHTGYVQNLWTDGQMDEAWGGHPTPDDTHVFVCGNPHMCEDVMEILESEGFKEHKRRDPGQVHVERYW